MTEEPAYMEITLPDGSRGFRSAPGGIGRWSSALSWDTRVVWNEQHQRYWWNAWLEATETELSGFADTREEAARAMIRAIKEARSR